MTLALHGTAGANPNEASHARVSDRLRALDVARPGFDVLQGVLTRVPGAPEGTLERTYIVYGRIDEGVVRYLTKAERRQVERRIAPVLVEGPNLTVQVPVLGPFRGKVKEVLHIDTRD